MPKVSFAIFPLIFKSGFTKFDNLFTCNLFLDGYAVQVHRHIPLEGGWGYRCWQV